MKRKHSKISNSKSKKPRVKDTFVEESISEEEQLSEDSVSDSDVEEEDEEVFEQEYKKQILKEVRRETNRLPIKTKEGVLQHSEDQNEEEVSSAESEDDDVEPSDVEDLSEDDTSAPKSVTAMELFTTQNKTLEEKKIQVGSLSAGILENPNEKISNFKTLFNLMNDKNIGNYTTIKKLLVVSLLEVFRDLLPSYKIKQEIDKSVKLKKDTLRLEKYEVSLLQYYKKYLQTLERMTIVLIKKKGSNYIPSKAEKSLGELAAGALCDLLQTHSYFNYADNIAQTVVPLLNNRNVVVQEKVSTACKNIFKEDKKGEITLKILRLINQYAKKHSNVKPSVIAPLLSLQIKDINLDGERENLVKQKKLMSHKSNVLRLSKMERKRKAKLQELEKELLEVKAEENKQAKKKNQTEITKVAFGLFFRMLKTTRNTKVLDVCLRGISKFAHCINVDFYVDLINILDNLMKDDWLDYSEQQRCIQTVFLILSQQGDILNLDPTRFYTGAYENLLTIHASKNYKDFSIVLETLTYALLKRHKRITSKRMTSFLKRITTLSLQLLHNGTLGCLGIVKSLFQLNKTLDILLDMESAPGDGKYLPELNDPEYSNASATALYELALLHSHYHPTVVEYANYIGHGVDSNICNTKHGRSTAEELFEKHDISQMAFCPAVPVIKKVEKKIKTQHHYFRDSSFQQYCKDTLKQSHLSLYN